MNGQQELRGTFTFKCMACGELAGTVALLGDDSSAQLATTGFLGKLCQKVGPGKFARCLTAVAGGDAGALYALELESVPFCCPGCGKCYCLAHWRTWNSFDSDGWHDSFRGVCPHGHQRMLLD